MDRLVFGVAPDGFPVAECELAADETGLLPALTEKAIRAGAERLWMHCAADLTGFGFQPREGYRRFTVAACPAGDPLPVLDVETIASLWPRAFGGQWGHRHVDAAMARTFAASMSTGSRPVSPAASSHSATGKPSGATPKTSLSMIIPPI